MASPPALSAPARKPATSEGITSEARWAAQKMAALGARFYLVYPESLNRYRQTETFDHYTRVFECLLEHTLRRQSDPQLDYAQVFGQIQADGTETGIRKGQPVTPPRVMTQADISRTLQMPRQRVSDAVGRLKLCGLVRQEQKRLHLVTDPRGEQKANVVGVHGQNASNLLILKSRLPGYLPPPDHPDREEWLRELDSLDRLEHAKIAMAVRQIRAAFREQRRALAARYLAGENRKSKQEDSTPNLSAEATPADQETAAHTPKPVEDAPKSVRCTRDKKPVNVTCTADSINKEKRERDCKKDPTAGERAGVATTTMVPGHQAAGQPARRDASVSKSSRQNQENHSTTTEQQAAERLRATLTKKYTRRFGVPPTFERAQRIHRALAGADPAQLCQLIDHRPHILGWTGVEKCLAPECARTQDEWRLSESEEPPRKKTSLDRLAEDFARRQHEKRKRKTQQQQPGASK